MEGIFIIAVGVVVVIWGLTPEWGRSWARKRNEKEGHKTLGMRVAVFLIGLVFFGGGVTLLALDLGYPAGSSSSASRYLSESTRRKIFYDITAAQDQNPYSTEWGEGVKQAAADHYGVPRSTISDIILEGATKGWLLPDPP